MLQILTRHQHPETITRSRFYRGWVRKQTSPSRSLIYNMYINPITQRRQLQMPAGHIKLILNSIMNSPPLPSPHVIDCAHATHELADPIISWDSLTLPCAHPFILEHAPLTLSPDGGQRRERGLQVDVAQWQSSPASVVPQGKTKHIRTRQPEKIGSGIILGNYVPSPMAINTLICSMNTHARVAHACLPRC